jgi:hypothetical protein
MERTQTADRGSALLLDFRDHFVGEVDREILIPVLGEDLGRVGEIKAGER